MVSFRFIGDPKDNFSGPDIIEFNGVKIGRIEFTTVPDDVAEKLRNNNHFEELNGASPSRPAPEPEATTIVPESVAVKKRGWPAGRPRTSRI